MEKRKGFYAELSTGKKKVVKYLQPYYYQGGRWFPLSKLVKEGLKNERRKPA